MEKVSMSFPTEYPLMAAITPANAFSGVFKDVHQSGFLSILYAIGQKPLEIWEKQIRSGHVKRITDTDIKSYVIEILGPNLSTTFITTPVSPLQSLGVRLPYLVLVVKNLKRYFAFEVQVLDDTGFKRRLKPCNFQAAAKIRPLSTTLTMKLEDGWNQVEMNLAELTKKIYGTKYIETTRVQIYANCRLRRVYFCDKIYGEEDVPADFKVVVINKSKSITKSSSSSNELSEPE